MKRLVSTSLAGILAGMLLAAPVFAEGEEVVVYKNPDCGCCGKWADHLREHGFEVREVESTGMTRIKAEAGVPQPLASCHTAKVGGYVIEGHVPAEAVRRLIDEDSELVGLAVPGMPQGSPGMEGPYPPERYEVIGFDAQGGSSVYARY